MNSCVETRRSAEIYQEIQQNERVKNIFGKLSLEQDLPGTIEITWCESHRILLSRIES